MKISWTEIKSNVFKYINVLDVLQQVGGRKNDSIKYHKKKEAEKRLVIC